MHASGFSALSALSVVQLVAGLAHRFGTHGIVVMLMTTLAADTWSRSRANAVTAMAIVHQLGRIVVACLATPGNARKLLLLWTLADVLRFQRRSARLGHLAPVVLTPLTVAYELRAMPGTASFVALAVVVASLWLSATKRYTRWYGAPNPAECALILAAQAAVCMTR